MKLEWGKKVCCPKCATPFYSMKKTSLICPNCGHKFEISELTNKKNTKIARDEMVEYDEKIAVTDFGQMDEDAAVEIEGNEALADEQAVVREINIEDS